MITEHSMHDAEALILGLSGRGGRGWDVEEIFGERIATRGELKDHQLSPWGLAVADQRAKAVGHRAVYCFRMWLFRAQDVG